MMKFDILTLFPEVFSGVLNSSILKNASQKGILEFNYINIRYFTNNKHKRVDDYPYGGGAGMLLQTQPIYDAYKYILDNSEKRPKTIYLSPRGRVFNQEIAKELSKEEHIVLICGHYEGIDQRIIDEICDYELSIGDYVLTGGELAAMVVCDSVSRLVPGVLSCEESYSGESHYDGLLEYPQYTRPPVFHNVEVPDVLLSGNDKNILKWREDRAYEITEKIRPDLIPEKRTIEKPLKSKLKYDLYYYGDSEKNLSAILLQLEKNELYPENVYKNSSNYKCDKNAIVVFDNSEFVQVEGENVKSVKLNNITDFENIKYEDFKNIESTEITTISNVVNTFLLSVECKKSCGIPENWGEKIKFSIKGKPAIELFENNKTKFNNVIFDDVFTIECNKQIFPDEYTVDIYRNSFVFSVIKVKSKVYGKKYIMFAKGLNEFIRQDNINCDNLEVVRGNYLKYMK